MRGRPPTGWRAPGAIGLAILPSRSKIPTAVPFAQFNLTKHNLTGVACEDACHDSLSVRDFAGCRYRVPDACDPPGTSATSRGRATSGGPCPASWSPAPGRWTGRARRLGGRRHDHGGARPARERVRLARPRDAPGQEGQPVAPRREVPPGEGRRQRPRPRGARARAGRRRPLPRRRDLAGRTSGARRSARTRTSPRSTGASPWAPPSPGHPRPARQRQPARVRQGREAGGVPGGLRGGRLTAAEGTVCLEGARRGRERGPGRPGRPQGSKSDKKPTNFKG